MFCVYENHFNVWWVVYDIIINVYSENRCFFFSFLLFTIWLDAYTRSTLDAIWNAHFRIILFQFNSGIIERRIATVALMFGALSVCNVICRHYIQPIQFAFVQQPKHICVACTYLCACACRFVYFSECICVFVLSYHTVHINKGGFDSTKLILCII